MLFRSGSYCPQPPNNSTCPSGYYETTYNGSKICVRNNPNPDQPNPNDPNNTGGGDGNGDGTGDGDGDTGGTGSIDFKPIIDAIKSLKDSLLAALSSISSKISNLIDGQQTTNDHLHNIEEATQATSEVLGDTNKKLDSVKDSIDSIHKCVNEGYNPNDKSSQKYRECTETDIQSLQGESSDTKVNIEEKTVNLEQDLRRDLFGSNSSCPPPLVIEFTFVAPVRLEFPYDLMCDGAALVRPWVILLGMLVSYFIITGQRSGGQD